MVAIAAAGMCKRRMWSLSDHVIAGLGDQDAHGFVRTRLP
jgi:hypothetical protein